MFARGSKPLFNEPEKGRNRQKAKRQLILGFALRHQENPDWFLNENQWKVTKQKKQAFSVLCFKFSAFSFEKEMNKNPRGWLDKDLC